MKHFIILLFFTFFLIRSQATNYYLSATGSNSNSGTSPVNPWQTISKLNTITFVPGDTVFLNSGDKFRGSISVNQGGNSFARVVFTSYGDGSAGKPIISGAETVTTWTLTGNYYQANFNQFMTSFFANDEAQILARYPNENQYLTLDSATAAYLKDASLTNLSAALINGSSVCVHTAQWCWEKSPVASYTGDKIIYTNATQVAGIANYSYFLYDNITHIDTAHEWKYDSTAQILSYKPVSGQNPNSLNCEASVYSEGITLGDNVSYVTVSGIAFEKQSNAGIAILNNTNKYILVEDCYFALQYNHGINDKGQYNEVANSYFRDIDGIAVYVNGSAFKPTIHHNTFRNIGRFRNSGIGMQINLTAIKCAFIDSCHIHHNDIDSTGYCGIAADGGYNLIERNIVKNAMLLNNDGAALKGYGANTHHTIFRNNFVSSGDGNTEGTFNGNFITPAIYFDFSVNNCTIQENTIYDRTQKGIFQNSGNNNNTIINNVVYGGNYSLDLNGSPIISTPITGMTVKHNSFFALDTNAYIIRQVDYTNTFNTGDIDSNYYFQPYDANKYALRITGTTPTSYSFSSWQSTGNDANTHSSFVSWSSSANYSRLFMNQTDSDTTINLLDSLYLDLDSNLVCGTIQLQPYTSKILINTNTTCSPSKILNKGYENNILVYPVPAVSFIYIQYDIPSNIKSLRLLDITGKEIIKKTEHFEYMNVDKVNDGVYLLEINISNTKSYKKTTIFKHQY